jgi:hypothetical protein
VYPATVQIPVKPEDHMNTVTFFPHLTMEDPPNFHQHITDLIFIKSANDTNTSGINILNTGRAYWNHVCGQLEKLKYELSLNFYITQF